MEPTEPMKHALVDVAKALRDQPLVWSDDRKQRTTEQVFQKSAQRQVRRAQIKTATLLCSAAALAFVVWHYRPSTTPPDTAAPALLAVSEISAAGVQLTDASSIRLLNEQSHLRTITSSNELVELELLQGGASFSVSKNSQRMFKVRFRDVVVQVMGTVFETEARDGQLFVRVVEGVVQVTSAGKAALLQAGQEGLFPPERAGVAAAEPAETVKPTAPAKPTRAAAAQPPATSDEAATLQEGIDQARARSDYATAAALSQTFLQKHADNPRAPLVQFTLAKIQLEYLQQPALAAETFAALQKRASDSPLSEDAAAREIEALAKAGQAASAHQHALDYVSKYPNSPRAEMVRHFGKLD